jgi:hypothetical protein
MEEEEEEEEEEDPEPCALNAEIQHFALSFNISC